MGTRRLGLPRRSTLAGPRPSAAHMPARFDGCTRSLSFAQTWRARTTRRTPAQLQHDQQHAADAGKRSIIFQHNHSSAHEAAQIAMGPAHHTCVLTAAFAAPTRRRTHRGHLQMLQVAAQQGGELHVHATKRVPGAGERSAHLRVEQRSTVPAHLRAHAFASCVLSNCHLPAIQPVRMHCMPSACPYTTRPHVMQYVARIFAASRALALRRVRPLSPNTLVRSLALSVLRSLSLWYVCVICMLVLVVCTALDTA